MAKLSALLPWQKSQWQRIKSLRDDKRLPHALLLSGSRFIGKQQFAFCLANSLLCLNNNAEGMACGECRSCLLNDAATHPDLKVVSPESEGGAIKIDQVRELVQFVTQTAQQGGRRVVILFPAEAMNINASNALLKSLEEPGTDTHLILVTDRPSGLLATIRSRCQSLLFNLPEYASVEPWFKQQALAEGIDDETLKSAFYRAGQRPMQAVQFLDATFIEQQEALIQGLKCLLLGEITPVALAEQWKFRALAEVLLLLYELSCDAVKRPFASEKSLYNLQLEQYFTGKGLFEWQALLLSKLNDLRSASNPNEQLLLEDILITASNYGKNT